MAIFKVPGNLTLHAAVAAAAASHDAENVIDIGPAVVHLNAAIVLDNAFNSSRKLTIRRDPALPPPRRGTIISSNPATRILAAFGAAYVRLQDLDFLRNVTNNQDLVVLSDCADFIIERCRIGSIWTTPGSEGWSNLRISSPTNVIVRNTILFALQRNTFDYGARIQLGSGFGHSLLLYNNVVADYEEYGIHATGPVGDAILLLRNNVAINHQDAHPEPVAYLQRRGREHDGRHEPQRGVCRGGAGRDDRRRGRRPEHFGRGRGRAFCVSRGRRRPTHSSSARGTGIPSRIRT